MERETAAAKVTESTMTEDWICSLQERLKKTFFQVLQEQVHAESSAIKVRWKELTIYQGLPVLSLIQAPQPSQLQLMA